MRRLESALSGGAACLFLSPHLDDAVLSCGALIQTLAGRALAGRTALTVATIFTAAAPPPHTFAARSFLRQCAAPDADTLFARRRAEDRAVLDSLGVAHAHLNVADALFRTRVPPGPVTRPVTRSVIRRLGRLCPELVHRYPTYRFDIARGRVSRGDRPLIERLAGDVSELVARTGAELVFCPVGVGRHVDHLITRTVGGRFPDRVVYYSDFPYNTSTAPDPGFLTRFGLVPWVWEHGIADKCHLIRGYRTQVAALFPDDRIPVMPETYYVTASF